MRLTKQKNPKYELQSAKQAKNPLISSYNYKNKEQENKFTNNIVTKNSSLKNIKDKIKTTRNSNIKENFSPDESHLKALKSVINATNRESQKNERLKLKPNLSSISYDLPLSYSKKNRTKGRIKNSFENISPINKTENKYKITQKDPELLDSPMNIIFQRNRNNLNNVISQSEVNIQYLTEKNGRNLNNLRLNKTLYNDNNENLFYHKVKYIRKKNNIKTGRNPDLIFDGYKEMKTNDEIHRNKSNSNFYVHKQINKSGIMENNNKTCNNSNIKKYRNNNQGINVFYSTKNINYDIMYNFRDNDSYNHHKNISQYDYYNLANNSNIPNRTYYNSKTKNKISNSLYIPEVDDESDTNFGENNYKAVKNINNISKTNYAKKKKRPIIRIINHRNYLNNDSNDNYYGEEKLKKKNESLFDDDLSPHYLNKTKDRSINRYITSENLNNIMNNKTINNNFSFHKKIFTNFKSKGTIPNMNNNLVNRNVFKKKSIKDNLNININSDMNKKNNYNIFKIFNNDSFNILSSIKNKIIFENENEIIDFINDKFNKQKNYNIKNKLNYTGYILSKRYKGKILFEIKIDDDINKFNKILKEENIKIGNDSIEVISLNGKENIETLKKKIINLGSEIEKIKQENDALNKKDSLKNQLIKKLDKEKQNLIEENNQLMNDIKKINKLNEDLNTKLKEINSKNTNIIKTREYKEENVIKLNIPFKNIITKDLSAKTNNEENKTPSSNERSNNLSINVNNSNMEIGLNEKKNNTISIFRLSKISEIKKMDNYIDSGDREIKKNLEILNEKLISHEENNGEINPFNNKDD